VGWCGMRCHCGRPDILRELALLKRGPVVIRRPSDLFQIRTLQRMLPWLMSGRPTLQQWVDQLEEERLALVRLGYYERKWLPWKERDMEWESAFANTAVWRGSGLMSLDSRRENEICITARPCDISEVDAIIRAKLGKRGGMPQPSDSADQSQPVSPKANLAPATAGSGR
jgi:hypothetical protein